ncbi:helix-turn-helix transcriptional regulator [Marinobacterium arenosum]|uniref:helix-turn-helix transcriptional regulator n=1 Tax=Marinobacterium arenosum TaxID=2862496 RepID=UPI001C944886|nr:helix-turn-helix transcriptional regulator [Marinobacterium arenosum]MBY4678411.1 helix-turn-helix transcriptional regulator [Marinobacterium arenosum]
MKPTETENRALTNPALSLPLASCIEGIGEEAFYPRFFQLMKLFARVEQYMVFEFPPDDGPASCRLAHNVQRPELGLQLASLYLDGAYRDDPLLAQLRSTLVEHPGQPAYQHLDRRSLPPVYRRRFYNVPDLGEKFALAALDPRSRHLFYINFYRGDDRANFSDEELDRLAAGAPLISALLLRQFRDERRKRDPIRALLAAGLSEREAQICGLIARGHSAKSIALRLELSENSVVTYRKRAYKKLAIQRKSQLLQLLEE